MPKGIEHLAFSFRLFNKIIMMNKISGANITGHGPIKVFYPGVALGNKTDTGFSSIGRIDHAFFQGNTIIPMHPHVNDEILTYFRSGFCEHLDTEGYTADISKTKLMLMKAGKSFYHEEKIIDKGEALEGLQIFIRPGEKDLEPTVTFLELVQPYSHNEWRAIASPGPETKLQFTSQTWIYDMRSDSNRSFQLPKLAKEHLTCLLYVFNGHIKVNNEIDLVKKDSLIIKDETVSIQTNENSDLVLFVVDENANYFDKGMYSGNQYCS